MARAPWRGVAAAESGNNAVCGANLIPLLTLGIPGDIGAAVLLGAFMIQGLHPGPMLFQENIVTVYAIFMALMMANVFNFLIGMVYIKFASKVVLIPKGYIFPAVLAFCFFGAYGFNQSLFDVWMVIIFGLMGYLLRRNGFPLAPLLIAFMLEPILESSFRQSYAHVGRLPGHLRHPSHICGFPEPGPVGSSLDGPGRNAQKKEIQGQRAGTALRACGKIRANHE